MFLPMSPTDSQQQWQQYCEREIPDITKTLRARGFNLDDDQPHIKGERFLMRAVTTKSGKKLILLGTDSDRKKVVIKTACDKLGAAELAHEHTCRQLLSDIDFAGEVFHTPEEVAYFEENGCTYSIQRFIEQESTFLERPIQEQFRFALVAFKGQESAHATTYKHRKRIGNTYGIRDANTYIDIFAGFVKTVKEALPEQSDLHTTLTTALETLRSERLTIEQYCGFLTHTDFVPHNIRIKDDTIYLLDHSSLTFGNKYEGWARFLNFMTLYNPELQQALEQYVKDNRTPEESVSLRLMRIFRLGELVAYYTKTLTQSEGNLLKLNTERISFWHTILKHQLAGTAVSASIITTYQQKRDALRSSDEKERQKGLH